MTTPVVVIFCFQLTNVIGCPRNKDQKKGKTYLHICIYSRHLSVSSVSPIGNVIHSAACQDSEVDFV